MCIYIMTHGDKKRTPNPHLTDFGKSQVRDLPLPADITQVIVGTGQRFADMFDVISPRLSAVPVKFSPLCGSADSGEMTETGFKVTLANGNVVPKGDYIGLIGTPGVDLLVWLNSLLPGTLLLAGRELVKALGYEKAEPGHLYRYDTGVGIRSWVFEGGVQKQ